MPSFLYTARDQRGVAQSGHLDAVSEDEVVAILQNRGLLVTSISKKEAAAVSAAKLTFRRSRTRTMHGRVTVGDQVMLCQQLATLIDAGIPLLKSLEVVSAQVESRVLLLSLEEVRRDVAAGRTFRDALARHPAVFSTMWLNLVETGEASGHLGQSLNQLARHFESIQHLRNEVTTALMYPACLIVAAILVLALFVYWLIPKFTAIFTTFDVELPLITRVMIQVSHIAKQYFVVVILGVVGIAYATRQYFRTEGGKWLRDRMVLQLPMFKPLFTYVQLAEFSRGLSTLLDSGVPLLSSLEILANSATNKVYGQAIATVKEYVKEGKTMAQPLEETGVFPPMTVQMVQVGEEVGELGKMVARVAKYYEERVEIFIARMTRLFEPIAIVVMGLLVLMIVVSIFLPIFKLAGGAGAN